MEFFDSLIKEALEITQGLSEIEYNYNAESCWQDVGFNEVILQRDTAFELDGVGFNLFTSANVRDGVTVIGDELQRIKSNRRFARVTIVQLSDCDDEQEAYKLIKKADYVKYHYFPEGYMIRTTSRTLKESVRVAKSALKNGISFEKAGNLLIKKYKENPKIKGVKVIFITNENADLKSLEDLAKKGSAITEALNHIMNNVNFDCDTCNLKPVCDEVEGMKELHFRNSKGM